MLVLMVFCVTRSLAVCQPSKACYVIKDVCALNQVLVHASCVCVCVYRLFALKDPSFYRPTHVNCHSSVHVMSRFICLLFMWARHYVRAWSFNDLMSSLTTEPGPAHQYCVGRVLREGAQGLLLRVWRNLEQWEHCVNGMKIFTKDILTKQYINWKKINRLVSDDNNHDLLPW